MVRVRERRERREMQQAEVDMSDAIPETDTREEGREVGRRRYTYIPGEDDTYLPLFSSESNETINVEAIAV